MKLTFGTTSLLLTILFTTTSGFATLLTSTWTGHVSNISGIQASSEWSLNEMLVVNITYDDSSTEMHRWADGANTIAEFGANDDTLDFTWNFSNLSGYDYLSDAEIILPSKVANYGNNYDFFPRNYSLVYYRTVPSANQFIAQKDFDGLQTFFGSDTGSLLWYDQANNNAGNQVYFSDISITTASAEPVPEPASMLLFGTAMAGLFGARLIRKK